MDSMKFFKFIGNAMFLGGIGYIFSKDWKIALALYIMIFGSNIMAAVNLHRAVDTINYRIHNLERKK